MTEVEIADGKLMVRVVGWDKVWSLKSYLEIPLQHVAGAHVTSEHVRGIKAPGSYIPGVITAGTFHLDGDKIFWDVHNPAKAIAIDLRHDRYARLIIEVADPAAAIALIQQAIK
jgi:hypothetical protein